MNSLVRGQVGRGTGVYFCHAGYLIPLLPRYIPILCLRYLHTLYTYHIHTRYNMEDDREMRDGELGSGLDVITPLWAGRWRMRIAGVECDGIGHRADMDFSLE